MKKLKHIKLFESFIKRNYRYKLLANNQLDILNGLDWFKNNFDITNGFVNAVAFNIPGFKDGTLLKYEIVEDHMPQFIKKSENGGYEIEIGLFNYDGKILPMVEEWNLDFIHKYMKKDNINCKIVELNLSLQESKTFGTSNEPEPSWLKKGIEVKFQDIINYLDDNNIPIVEISVKDVINMCAHTQKNDKETLDRSERSNLDYPIIVVKKNDEYHMILDGHHRLLKAKNNNISKIKARVFELSDAPDDFQIVFN